ncbi:MAG: hypothetical protein ACFHX7_23940 [Pseudomonadota bacterium]
MSIGHSNTSTLPICRTKQMDIRFELNPISCLIIVTVTGSLRFEDLDVAMEQLRALPGFEPSHDQLLDLAGARLEGFSAQKIRAFLERPPLFDTESRRAIVVGSKFAFGMVRMFELMANQERGAIRVFMNLEEAVAWLHGQEP